MNFGTTRCYGCNAIMNAGGPIFCVVCRTEKAIKSQTATSTREHEDRMRGLEHLLNIIQTQQPRIVSHSYHEPIRFLPENCSEEEKQEWNKKLDSMTENKRAWDEKMRIVEQKERRVELCVAAIVIIALYFLIF